MMHYRRVLVCASIVTIVALSGCDYAAAAKFAPLTKQGVEQTIRQRWAGTGQADRAVRIARCESKLNPAAKNRSSSASGVFQIIRGTWNAHASKGMSVWNARHNIEVAYRIWLRSGRSFRQWVCRG